VSLGSAKVRWAVLAAVVVVLLWHRRVILFGPVFFYDVIRLARRGRYAVLRSLYGLGILGVLLYMGLRAGQASVEVVAFQAGLGQAAVTFVNNQQALARFSESFFLAFMYAQFAAILLLTPAYTAGAIAEEKERKTLEYLFTTCIGGGEIVVSKLMARLGNLAILLLVGVPILSLTPLWGGVDPMLVLAGFAASAMTMASLAALSILFSVYAQKARHAIVLTYATAALYFAVTYFSPALVNDPLVGNMNLIPGTTNFTYGELLSALGIGNILLALRRLQEDWQAGISIAVALPVILARYTIFHGCIALVCTAWAVARIRITTLAQRPQKVRQPLQAREPRRPKALKPRVRPAVGDLPMVWKELYTGRTSPLSRIGRRAIIALAFLSFVPLLWFWADLVLDKLGGAGTIDPGNPWQNLIHSVLTWVRVEGAFVACLGLVVVALNAASSVSGERDHGTWDSLLSTSLGVGEILSPKRLGSVFSARWLVLWLCLVWLLGALHGGLNLWRLPVLLLAWAIYAACAAALGLYLSIRCGSSLRASMWTLALIAGMALGPALLGTMLELEKLAPETSGPGYTVFVSLVQYGLAPQTALNALASPQSDFWRFQFARHQEAIGVTLGFVVYTLLIAYFGMRASQSFRKQTGRTERVLPTVEELTWRRRWRRGLVAATAVCLAIGVGGDAIVNIKADRRLHEAIAEVERDDPDWRWQSVGKGQPVIASPHNWIEMWGSLPQGSYAGTPRLLTVAEQLTHMDRSIGDKPSWAVQSILLAAMCSEAESLQSYLAKNEATSEGLASIQDVWEKHDRQPTLTWALRGTRGAIDQQLQDIQDGKIKLKPPRPPMPSPFQPPVPPSAQSVPKDDGQRVFAPGHLSNQRAKLLRYFTRLIALSRLPLEEQVRAIDKMEPLGADPLLIGAASLDQLVPNLAQMRDLVRNYQQMQAHVRCAIVMVAVERYRLAHGRWPGSLTELAPEQLQHIPLDPYSGRPVGYRRLADGVVIYSVGPDGSNDGSTAGIPGSDVMIGMPFGAIVGATQSPQLAFRLRDVGLRRLPNSSLRR
jgi:ABC-type transport system involved in multi-copper enzyme maturation permease subunit